MFRRGPGGCYEREGRRPWCLLGHARVAIVLMVNAVAACIPPSTCTATDFVITPRSCGLVLGHHHDLLPLVSHHIDCLPRSCLRPSESAAAPELPVLEIAGQHRTCTVVTPTSMPGQREDVQTGASTLFLPLTGQRVNHSASGILMYASIRSNIATYLTTTLRSARLFPQRHPHIRNIYARGRCYCAYAAGTPHLPLIDRSATRVSAGDLPCLKQPLLALDARDTDGRCYAASFLLRCTQFGRTTRVGQGQGVVGPTSATSRALRARRFAAFRGQVTMNANAARRDRPSHTRSAPPHCTTTTATSATGRATSHRKTSPCSDQLPMWLPLPMAGVVTYLHKFDTWVTTVNPRCCTAPTTSAQASVKVSPRGFLLLPSVLHGELCTPHHDQAMAASLHCTCALRPHPNTGRPPGRPIAAVGLPQAS